MSPHRTLLVATGVVAASSALLHFVGGYGTILYQAVVLNAWDIVASLSSAEYADLNPVPVLLVAVILSVVGFLIPAVILWLLLRTRWPKACTISLAVWCAFYLAALFFLFPAQDGP